MIARELGMALAGAARRVADATAMIEDVDGGG